VNKIFLLVETDSAVVNELRSMGGRVQFRAERGTIATSAILGDTSEWRPEFVQRVHEVLSGDGLRELREGVWGPADTDEDSLRRWHESARDAQEYTGIWRTMTEHSDWSDQEVADSCGAKLDDVAYYRSERDN
jgi:hypothetical protein